MKAIVCVCLFGLMAAALARPEDSYSTEHDNIDLDEILGNDRLLVNYCKCLIDDKVPCTAEGKKLKSVIPDALQNECSKCNEKQKAGAEKVIRFLIKNKEECWASLKNKYDPEGVYSKKYEDEEKRVSQ